MSYIPICVPCKLRLLTYFRFWHLLPAHFHNTQTIVITVFVLSLAELKVFCGYAYENLQPPYVESGFISANKYCTLQVRHIVWNLRFLTELHRQACLHIGFHWISFRSVRLFSLLSTRQLLKVTTILNYRLSRSALLKVLSWIAPSSIPSNTVTFSLY